MKNTICAIPWVHLNIIPRGKVYPCCMTTDFTGYAGDLNTQTIEEIWNSDYMKKVRVQMLNGEEPKMCSRCFESERSSGNSSRIHHNLHFDNKLKEIPVITQPDGHVDNVDLKYWDFRFSNLCNYKCRSCGPEYSSAWIPDARALGWTDEKKDEKVITINVDETNNVDFLKKYVDVVEKIYFAGGEPLLMDEHWQILDMLDEKERHNVVITYNTNLSKLTYKDKNVLDYWKKWGRRAWIWPSIDEVGERAELIRSGTVWKTVEKNLREIAKLNIHIKPNITVSNMNVFRLPEIIQELIDIGIIKKEYENMENFNLNVLEFAKYLHVSTLSDDFRQEIRKKLDIFITEYQVKYNVDIRNKFLHLFWHLEKPYDSEMAQMFIQKTEKVDKLRGENTFQTIPELNDILENAKF